jgi:2-amino-4-hydroxy-6-hydroxymethyldihydropteridine diphosphokinase
MDPSSKSKKSDALIAFGANQGDCSTAWKKAIELLDSDPAILELTHSDPIETVAATGSSEPQSKYLNGAIRVLTTLTPHELHQKMIGIEQQLGRERAERWGPRTIDLDLLLVGDLQSVSDELIVPHPRMSYRRFVLLPALDIAANMVHPNSGMTLQNLVDYLDEAEDRILVATNVVGPINEALSEIKKSLADQNCPEFVVVETVEQFMKYATGAKLAVSFFESKDEGELDDPLQSLQRFSENFAGPTLHLSPESGLNAATTEILAAIEAMRPQC